MNFQVDKLGCGQEMMGRQRSAATSNFHTKRTVFAKAQGVRDSDPSSEWRRLPGWGAVEPQRGGLFIPDKHLTLARFQPETKPPWKDS